MEIQILVSKKGTKVVTAHQLHQALRLTDYKYNKDVQKWLTDIYAFEDGVRQPIEMQDYSIRHFQHSKMLDYYISVELAILIALRSNSTVKQFYTKYLIAMSNTNQDNTKNVKQNNNNPKVNIVPEIIDRSTMPSGVQLGLW